MDLSRVFSMAAPYAARPALVPFCVPVHHGHAERLCTLHQHHAGCLCTEGAVDAFAPRPASVCLCAETNLCAVV
eukprot:1157882-Pelagomonas_calceolata.AAC.1